MEVKGRGYSFTPEGFSNLLGGDGLIGGLLKIRWEDVFYLKHVEGTRRISIKYYGLENLRSIRKTLKVQSFEVRKDDVEPIKEIARSYIPDVIVEERGRKYTEAGLPFFVISALLIIGSVFGAIMTGYMILLAAGLGGTLLVNIIGMFTYDKEKKITVYKTGDKPGMFRTRF